MRTNVADAKTFAALADAKTFATPADASALAVLADASAFDALADSVLNNGDGKIALQVGAGGNCRIAEIRCDEGGIA
jgi:peptidyl-tRNA hydrolase